MGKGAWGRRKGPSPEVLELEGSLQETRALIAQAYAGFNSAVDGDLVESYIYEIQALQARYSYLLRRRKALEGEVPKPLSRKGPGVLPAEGQSALPVA